MTKENQFQIHPVNYLDDEDEKTNIRHSNYSDILIHSLNHEDISNIGLVGPYGSGKTTIINELLKNNEEIRNKSVKISLGAYHSDTSDSKISSEEVQLEILQQIFAQAENKNLSGKLYTKFSKDTLVRKIGISLLLIMTLALFFTVLNIFNSLLNLNIGTKDIFIASIAILVLAAVPLLSYFSIKNIEFSGMKMETAGGAPQAFNYYFQELEFFVNNSPKRYFFFEDLDRIEAPGLFTDLKNLNASLNFSNKSSDNVIFIYLVGDDFLNTASTAVNHTLRKHKFFDLTIPVLPHNANQNPWDYIESEISNYSDIKGKYSSQYENLKIFTTNYLSDTRTLSHIVTSIKTYHLTKETLDKVDSSEDNYAAILYFILNTLAPRLFFPRESGLTNLVELFNNYSKLRMSITANSFVGHVDNQYKSGTELTNSEQNGSKEIDSISNFSSYVLFLGTLSTKKDKIVDYQYSDEIATGVNIYDDLSSNAFQQKLIRELFDNDIIDGNTPKLLRNFIFFKDCTSVPADTDQENHEQKTLEMSDDLSSFMNNIDDFRRPTTQVFEITRKYYPNLSEYESLYQYFKLADSMIKNADSQVYNDEAIKKFREKLISTVKEAYLFSENKDILTALLEISLNVNVMSIRRNPNEVTITKNDSTEYTYLYSERKVETLEAGDDKSNHRVYVYPKRSGKNYDGVLWILRTSKEVCMVQVDSPLIEQTLTHGEPNNFLYSYNQSTNDEKILALNYRKLIKEKIDGKISTIEKQGLVVY
ncbi:KAP family NTPase [Rothia nasimurium]|uniref:KAP family NTPase n=2 Tax=Rothia nasimurium TaxID=85336 RepID=UPI001F2F3114|nr:KAP family NTPase [Rothia nasimurium]